MRDAEIAMACDLPMLLIAVRFMCVARRLVLKIPYTHLFCLSLSVCLCCTTVPPIAINRHGIQNDCYTDSDLQRTVMGTIDLRYIPGNGICHRMDVAGYLFCTTRGGRLGYQ